MNTDITAQIKAYNDAAFPADNTGGPALAANVIRDNITGNYAIALNAPALDVLNVILDMADTYHASKNPDAAGLDAYTAQRAHLLRNMIGDLIANL